MNLGVFVVDGVADFGLAAVLEVLGTANSLRDQLAVPPPEWSLRPLGTSSTVLTGAGHQVPVTPLHELDVLPDLLVVPASNVKDADGLIATVRSAQHAPVLDLVADTHRRGGQVAAACTGTFFLAEAGVLNGRSATTSWWLAPVFRRRFPEVQLDESRTLCRAGTVTTAGAAFAHIDLALSIVRAASPALAELVARYLLVGNRAAQADFAVPVLAAADPVTAEFERWVRDHLDEPISIAGAARELGVSERNLQRSAAATLGMSPLEFVTEIRIDHAAHLLRTTSLSIDAIAGRVGYLNGSTLRDSVRRRRGVTMRELRGGMPRDRPHRPLGDGPVHARRRTSGDDVNPGSSAPPAGTP